VHSYEIDMFLFLLTSVHLGLDYHALFVNGFNMVFQDFVSLFGILKVV
jgi:hypothetical protein